MASSFPFTDFAVNMTNVVSSYLPPQPITPTWTWVAFLPLLLPASYVFDFGSKIFRDRRLRKFGSPPVLVPFKAPFGRFSKHHPAGSCLTLDRRGRRHILRV